MIKGHLGRCSTREDRICDREYRNVIWSSEVPHFISHAQALTTQPGLAGLSDRGGIAGDMTDLRDTGAEEPGPGTS